MRRTSTTPSRCDDDASCAACARTAASVKRSTDDSAVQNAARADGCTLEDRFWEGLHQAWFSIPQSPELPKTACPMCGTLAQVGGDVSAFEDSTTTVPTPISGSPTVAAHPFFAQHTKQTASGALYVRGLDASTQQFYPDASLLPPIAPSRGAPMMRLVCISDTHDAHFGLAVPPGDVLIHAGDVLLCSRRFSVNYCKRKLRKFNAWLGTLPHRHRIVIGGNHCIAIELMGRDVVQAILTNATYLEYDEICIPHPQDSSAQLRVFGCPYSRGHSKNAAFQPASFPFKRLPPPLAVMSAGGATSSVADVPYDVVVTHAPFMTRVPLMGSGPGAQDHGPRWARVAIGGHLHSHYGVHDHDGTLVVVACSMNDKYAVVNAPIVVDIPLRV